MISKRGDIALYWRTSGETCFLWNGRLSEVQETDLGEKGGAG